jgi:hypothetical protein
MERDVAIRIDAFLQSIRDSFASVAGYMKRNLTEREYAKYVQRIASGMTETVKLSNELHRVFPDIVPAEVRDGSPPPEGWIPPKASRPGRAARKSTKSPKS